MSSLGQGRSRVDVHNGLSERAHPSGRRHRHMGCVPTHTRRSHLLLLIVSTSTAAVVAGVTRLTWSSAFLCGRLDPHNQRDLNQRLVERSCGGSVAPKSYNDIGRIASIVPLMTHLQEPLSLRGAGHSMDTTRNRKECAWSFLATLLLILLFGVKGSLPARASDEDVSIYFGQGCFWHVQHEMIRAESELLRRSVSQLTAVAGYAGGSETGPEGKVCYHNRSNAPDYGKMGHAEVVGVSIPSSSVGDFARRYFDAASANPFGRNDPQNFGAEYRSVVGLPGGAQSPFYKELLVASEGRVKLLAGIGVDADTLLKREVYVYDSTRFPFFQAELYHQFHDDMIERYGEDYKQLKNGFKYAGKLRAVSCPDEKFWT